DVCSSDLIIHKSIGHPLKLEVERGKEKLTLTVTPEAGQIDDEENGKPIKKTVGLIGFSPRLLFEWKKFGWQESVVTGTQAIYQQVTMIPKVLFSKQAPEVVGGPIDIDGQVHQDSQEGPRRVLYTSAMLSVSLCIM